jgi:hypothetical protein
MSYAHSFDGQVSFVVGTHTHCPSADHQVLPGGTAFQSDAGMCGDYDSVIGMVKESAAARFWRKMPGESLQPADGPATVCGVFVETDDNTGLATRIEPVRQGGRHGRAFAIQEHHAPQGRAGRQARPRLRPADPRDHRGGKVRPARPRHESAPACRRGGGQAAEYAEGHG